VSSVLPKECSIFAFDIPFYAPPPFDLSTMQPSTTKPEEDDSSGQATNALETTSLLEGAPKIRFELYGNQFRFRSSDRATRKFKPKETIEL
jgi:ribonuclease P protein subunit POP4